MNAALLQEKQHMEISSGIAVCLLFLVTVHEVRYWKSVAVKAALPCWGRLAVCGGIGCMAGIAAAFAAHWFHGLVLACGVLLVIADVHKQGLSEAGLLMAARGRELYRWEEIHHAEITTSTDGVTVVYYVKIGSVIAKRQYRQSTLEKIMQMLKQNRVPMR